MKQKPRPQRNFRVGLNLSIGTLLVLISLPLSAQTVTPVSAPPANPADTVVVLSPFQVDASKDAGYKAQTTLSGTRLNASVGDLGSTMTILTPDAWEDLGLFSTNDLILYTPGGDTRNGNDSETNSGDLYWGDKTVFRGIAVENIVRNYFRTEIPSDTYNTDRMEFTRGPNAVLFGVAGDATGLVNRATQDANLGKNSTVYSSQFDNFHSARNSLNLNHVLIRDKLAFRLALLDSDQNRWLKPSDYQDQSRYYLAAQYKPIKQLSIKASYEHFRSLRSATSASISFDSVTPWLNAGKPGRAAAAGAVNANLTPWFRGYSSNSPRLMAVYDGSSENPVYQDWNNRTLGANLSVIGSTSVSLPPNFMDRRFDVSGQAASQNLHGGDVNVFVDYALTKDLNIQLAGNDETVYYDFINAGNNGRLNVDASTTLATGAANPNFGRYFTVSEASYRLKQVRYRRDQRLTASYHLDFGKLERFRWLGVHDVAAMYERDTSQHYWDVLTLRNTTPLPGASAFIGDVTNMVRFIDYVDIASDAIAGNKSSLDWQAEANKLPGVNAQWLPTGAPTAFLTILNSQLYVLQSHFWDNRLVTTLGWRKDGINQNVLDTTTLTPLYPVGSGAPFSNYARSGTLTHDTTASRSPENKTVGAVFHLLRNKGILDSFDLTYNQSTSFTISAFHNAPDRSTNPAQTGKTRDIGVRTELWNRRIGMGLTFFDAAVENTALQISSVTTPMSNLFQLIGKSEFVSVPQVADFQDKTSKGYEFQVTANITPNWRLMGSLSTYTTVNANVANLSGRLIEQYKSQWLANPTAIVPNSGTDTAQLVYDNLVFQYQILKASEGQRSLLERKYKFVTVTNYTVSEGVLKGLSLGANVVWQSVPATGYALKAVVNASTRATSWVPDADHVFYGSTLMNVGASIGYNWKLWHDRVRWSTQLNVRNLFGVDPFVTRTGANATDPTTAIARVYSRGEPTTVMLTNTFRF